MTLAPYIQAVGRGPSKARHLARVEAADAMEQMLSGDAPPEAVGALLMLMRYRGETAEEIAGFVDGARARLSPWKDVSADLDWPSYAAGRTRGLPWFLLSAKLVAAAGARVLLHGWNSHQQAGASVRGALRELGIASVETPRDAEKTLSAKSIAYAPLETLSPALWTLLRLRETLGLRSCVNTVLRMTNPSGAPTTVQGVFHPSYRLLQRDAASLLGQTNLAVIKGGGGEFERHPSKAIAVFGLRDAEPFDASFEPSLEQTRRLADEELDPTRLHRLWDGTIDDPFALEVVLGTAEAALWISKLAPSLTAAREMAEALWRARDPALAA